MNQAADSRNLELLELGVLPSLRPHLVKALGKTALIFKIRGQSLDLTIEQGACHRKQDQCGISRILGIGFGGPCGRSGLGSRS